MKILSLFDGMSVAQQALKEAEIPVETYYASEIDPYAIAVTQSNFPNTIQLGDVTSIAPDEKITDWLGKIDLLIGGSPCQDLSIAKKDRKGLDGSRSGLFWEYVRIRNEVKPKYFILENVNSMPKEAKEIISEALGVQPVMINASLVSAQNRKRLFWVGKWNGEKYEQAEIPQPEDKGILLKDILEDGSSDRLKSYCIDANYYKGASWKQYIEKGRRQLIKLGSVGKDSMGSRVYSPEGIAKTLSANGGGWGAKTGLYAIGVASRTYPRTKIEGVKRQKQIEVRDDEKANSMTSVQGDSLVAVLSNYNNTLNYEKSNTLGSNSQCQTAKTGQGLVDFEKQIIRKLTPIECLRLQSMPDDYFDKAVYKNKPISNTQRYKMCGNAFNKEVIVHILKHLN